MRPLLLALCLLTALPLAAEPFHPPLMRDFIGLNVHTVQFKPDLYRPVCRLLRDYHPVHWDTGDDSAHPTTFPLAANKVDWSTLYGQWTKTGYEVDACLMFESLKPNQWKDPARDARAYGESFARYFGPSGQHPWVTSAEIGNEPAAFTPDQYRTLFQGMAQGLRAGDPKLKIATCAVMTGQPDKWSKPISAVEGLTDLYDILNIHSYAFKDQWPTWRRAHPEDPKIRHLKDIAALIDWRDKHAPAKPIWLTEFGYDSSTKQPDPKGQWKDWQGVTDEQQAQYTVRSLLLYSSMPLDRAYLYFFNDKDEPQLHGASGITRNYHPKPAFHALAHLYKTLGDYRFNRALKRDDADYYCFEYTHATKPNDRILVAWLPTTGQAPARKSLPLGPIHSELITAQRMPLSGGPAPDVSYTAATDNAAIDLEVSESPTYLHIRAR